MSRARDFVVRAKEKLKSLGLELVEVYLVGSRARGDYLVNSDIDIVLVVKGVKRLSILERLEAIKDILEPHIDSRIYNVEEWMNEDSAWVKALKREALKIGRQ